MRLKEWIHNKIFLGCLIGTIVLLFVIFRIEPVRKLLYNNWIVAHIKEERQKVKTTAKATTLNHLMPSFDTIAQYIQEQNPKKNAQLLLSYVNYYEKVVEYFPQVIEAYNLLGFCYFELQENEKAIGFYRKAITLDPSNFGANYSLGAISYQNKNYTNAIRFFRKVVSAHPKDVIQTLTVSKVYRQIASANNFNYNLGLGLQQRYEDSYLLLCMSDYYMGNYPRMFKTALMAIKGGFDSQGYLSFVAGLAAYQLREYDQAIVFFQKAITFNRQNYDALKYLVLSLEAVGKKDVAQEISKRMQGLKQSKSIFDKKMGAITPKMF